METKRNCKTVIITGGNKGIGEEIARTFWNSGYCVVIGARTESDWYKSLSERLRFKKVDIRFLPDHMALAETATSWTGRLDAYINCAGFSEWQPINEITEDFWNKMIDTNLKGTFWGCKVASEHLSDGGCIINISSLAGKRGSANNSVYCASKFGVNGLTQALAKELGPRGIRVNAVCPVYIETEGLQVALKDEKSPSKGKDIPKFLKEFALNNAALRRLPQAREVAELCLFLASPVASAITGQCINVDCGVMTQ